MDANGREWRSVAVLDSEFAFIGVNSRLIMFLFHDFSNRRVKSFRVFCVVHGFQLNRDTREALSYVLRSVRSFEANESVSIGVHQWLREMCPPSRHALTRLSATLSHRDGRGKGQGVACATLRGRFGRCQIVPPLRHGFEKFVAFAQAADADVFVLQHRLDDT